MTPGTQAGGPAVVLLVFNRPDTTRRVFEAIRAARPARLLVVADGPRPGREGEAEACEQARDVIRTLDWDCQVVQHYAEENLGCARRLASGLDWVFSQVDRAIILEDDCVPDPSFFPYCAELLERFADDSRVMAISGDNFQSGPPRTGYSYYFSRFVHIWGWATWRRAWQQFDLTMEAWPEVRDGGWLGDLLGDPEAETYWRTLFDLAHRREIDTWDFAWLFAVWRSSGLTVLPATNLVENIGFDERATHTRTPRPEVMRAARGLALPLRHPPFVIRDARADRETQVRIYQPLRSRTLWQRGRDRIRARLAAPRLKAGG